MSGLDVSEFNRTLPAGDFYVIRTSHGKVQDPLWRQHYNDAFHANKPVGFYHVPESTDVAGEAAFFRDLVTGIPHTLGDWLDFGVGDVPPRILSAAYVDEFRGVFDTGLYVNGAALVALGHTYDRFERLWFAGPHPPPRWLLWQTGALNAGVDVDLAADLLNPGLAAVSPHWSAFAWPDR
jgi:hypothetical protein